MWSRLTCAVIIIRIVLNRFHSRCRDRYPCAIENEVSYSSWPGTGSDWLDCHRFCKSVEGATEVSKRFVGKDQLIGLCCILVALSGRSRLDCTIHKPAFFSLLLLAGACPRAPVQCFCRKAVLAWYDHFLTHIFSVLFLCCFSESLSAIPLNTSNNHGDQVSHTARLQCPKINIQKKTFDITTFFHHRPRCRPFASYLEITEVKARSVEKTGHDCCCTCNQRQGHTQPSFQPRLPQK